MSSSTPRPPPRPAHKGLRQRPRGPSSARKGLVIIGQRLKIASEQSGFDVTGFVKVKRGPRLVKQSTGFMVKSIVAQALSKVFVDVGLKTGGLVCLDPSGERRQSEMGTPAHIGSALRLDDCSNARLTI